MSIIDPKLPLIDLRRHLDGSIRFETIIDLPYEYEVAAPAAGSTKAQIQQAQRNALEVASMSAQEKSELADQHRGASPL